MLPAILKNSYKPVTIRNFTVRMHTVIEVFLRIQFTTVFLKNRAKMNGCQATLRSFQLILGSEAPEGFDHVKMHSLKLASKPYDPLLTGHVHSRLRICRGKWIEFHCNNNAVVSWKKHRYSRPICSYPRCVSMLQTNITTPYTMPIYFTANFNVSALNVPFSCFTSVIPKESLQKICNIVAHK